MMSSATSTALNPEAQSFVPYPPITNNARTPNCPLNAEADEFVPQMPVARVVAEATPTIPSIHGALPIIINPSEHHLLLPAAHPMNPGQLEHQLLPNGAPLMIPGQSGHQLTGHRLV